MKTSRKKVIIAAVIAGISAAVILVGSLKSRQPATNSTASALANDLATNLSATKTQLTNLVGQAQTVDVSPFSASLRTTFNECDRLARQLEQQADSKVQGWAKKIQQATSSGRDALSRFEDRSQKLNESLTTTSNSATQVGEQMSLQQETINRLIAVIGEQRSSKRDAGPIPIATGLLGLLGSLSTILLAWRTDARELAKLQLEVEKLRSATISNASKTTV